MTKNVISGKPKGFERSYLEAKFTTPDSTLRKPHYRDGHFLYLSSGKNFSISKVWEKILKASYLENYKDSSSHIQRQDLQPWRVPSQFLTTGLRSG